MALMSVAAVIPTGAMAERWRWSNFCLYGLWIALPFGVCAHWVWGGGWLAQAGRNWGLGHGAVDFAGSGVVHVVGGMIGLAGAIAMGPRIGKYVGKRAQAIPGHSVPLMAIGSILLTVGWLGFNSGWVFAATDLRIGLVVVNTVLAGAAGAVASMLYLQVRRMKPDPSLMCNGLLAGLVAISASCAFVDLWAAALIGAVAGVLVVIGIFFWDRVHIDDPVGAISIHGLGGLWGLVALGLFANGRYGDGWNGVVRHSSVPFANGGDRVRGALYGDYGQLAAQLLEAAVLAVFAFVLAYAWFKLSNRITPLRVSAEVEVQGLDLPEMGATGYPDFTPRGLDTRRWG
jgi:Amt family ammonium transporter